MRSKVLFQKEDTYSLRGICMIAIIFHHLYQWTASKYGVHYPLFLGIIFQNIGYLATSVFFLISGFGVSTSLGKSKITFKSACRRIWNLYEPFLFYYIVGLVICVTTDRISFPNILTGLLTFDLPVIGGGKWFVISIFGFYIEIVLYSLRLTPSQILLFIWVITCFYIGIQILILKFPPVWYNSLLAFPLGVTCAIRNNKKISATWKNVFFLVSLFLIFFSFSLFSEKVNVTYLNSGSCRAIIENITCVSFSLLTILVVSLVNVRNRILRFIGENSFSFFLAHLVLITFANMIPNASIYIIFVLVNTFVMTFIYIFIKKRVKRLLDAYCCYF